MGYGQNKKIIITPFANDFNSITTQNNSHQRIINKVFKHTHSMTLKLKPPKCVTLVQVSGKLTRGTPPPKHILYSTITNSGKQSDKYQMVLDHFTPCLSRIDKLEIRAEYEL